MTEFHKLFMVKINKMIKKKTGGILLVIYVIYSSIVYIDSKKLCLVHSPTAGSIPSKQLSKSN